MAVPGFRAQLTSIVSDMESVGVEHRDLLKQDESYLLKLIAAAPRHPPMALRNALNSPWLRSEILVKGMYSLVVVGVGAPR